jgi:hypothetical protein
VSGYTVAGLVQDVVASWGADRDGDEVALSEYVADVVPAHTRELFQMVVDDVSLAFIDGPEETSEPFRCLSRAIGAEVERLAEQEIKSILEREREEREDDDG